MKDRIHLIRQKFQKNMEYYDAHAIVQKKAASRLHQIITQHYCETPNSILEIGCGTGLLTKKIIHSYQTQHYYLNDINEQISDALKETIRKQSHTFLIGDAQKLVFPSGMDLILSSSTIQWFEDTPEFFRKIEKNLSAQGCFFFSSFGNDNLREIRSLTSKGLDYISHNNLKSLLNQHFEILHSSEETVTLTFQSPVEILRHLKLTGVTGPFSSIWTKATLAQFCQQYTSDFCRNGVFPLTYHPLYFGLRKRTL